MAKATKLPVLYHLSKTGKMCTWETWTIGEFVWTKYGQVGGGLQTSRKASIAKSVGHSNATTAAEQAKLDSKRMWKKRLDTKYRSTPDAAKEKQTLPMLAEKYDKRKADDYTWPVYVQPKLDGVRCTSLNRNDVDKAFLQSRNGKEYKVPHIAFAAAQTMKKNNVPALDGEIYIHGLTFQELSSLIKRQQPGSEKLEYWVYDIPSDGEWSSRSKVLNKLAVTDKRIVIVKGAWANDDTDVAEMHNEYVKQGYEGAMIRLPDGVYEWNHRSKYLLKYKTSQDAEFKVIDVEEGRGRMSGCAIFWCTTGGKEDIQFSCMFKGTMKIRQEQWRNREKYMGRMLTVRFNGYTDDGSVRFPRGVRFRDSKDLPKERRDYNRDDR